MCRRNQIFGVAMAGFGLGLLVAGFFDSVFFCGCLGFGIAVVGILVVLKK